jgi:hypothetical protein
LDAKTDQASERRFWSRWAIGAGAVLLLAIVAFVCVRSYDASLVRRVKELTDELDRTEPDWRDPQTRLAPLPPARDSMLVVQRVKSLLPARWMNDIDQEIDRGIDLTPPPCRLPPGVRKVLEGAVKRCPAALSEARTLSDFADGRFPPTLVDDEVFKKIEPVREVAWIVQCATRTAVERDDFADAWVLCRAQLSVCKPFREGMFWVGTIRAGNAAQLVNEIQCVLAHGEIPETDLEPMQRRLTEEAEADLGFVFLRFDRARSTLALDRFLEGKESVADAFQNLHGQRDAEWGDRWHEWFPRYFILDSKIRTLERIVAMDRLKTLRGFARYDALDALDGRFGPGVEPFVWDFNRRRRVFDVERRTEALLGCAAVGLAAERHRLKFGHWPATAKDLVDKGLLASVPEDPFDGAPLRMRLPPDGLVVYAVGRQKDYDGTRYDDFDHFLDRPNGTEFRLWNPDRRHQPPRPDEDLADPKE